MDAFAADLTASAFESGDLAVVPCKDFDALRKRSDVDWKRYSSAYVDEPRVQFASDWLRRMNETRAVTRWLRDEDVRQIAKLLAVGQRDAVSAALQGAGFVVLPKPMPGALRVAPELRDVFINAPYVPVPGVQVGVVHDSAGRATMDLEIRDEGTGTLLLSISLSGEAITANRYVATDSTMNLFLFDGLFRRWAERSVLQLSTTR